MKKTLIVASTLLSMTAMAAPLQGARLQRAVLKLGKCQAANGTIEFLKQGYATLTDVQLPGGGPYEGPYNGEENSGSYDEPAPAAEPDSSYNENGDEDADSSYQENADSTYHETSSEGPEGVVANWNVKGQSVYLLVNGKKFHVQIGFRSKTCVLK